ncbi:hypothetical protein Tco_0730506 [Tanacetum coccineum]|uniref:Uncharacterized protein n=1 Tax=Tanacetum coccineum TaxID=301880 RepID=A0ABQ4YSC8_9ASTR
MMRDLSDQVLETDPGAFDGFISPLLESKDHVPQGRASQVCLLCEGILQQIPAFYFICASLEAISAIEMLWEWRGIANMAFIQLGGNSRVDEMILARVSSGFAGEKYRATYKL